MRGQTLVELLIAVGVFVVVASSLAFLILDSYNAGRLSQEIIIADFLTEEGIEAVKSIRDNSWASLAAGTHGLTISGGNWIFSGTEENISSQIKKGIRKIIVEDIDADRKKITSQVAWEFTSERPQTLSLITYFTNWQKVSGIEVRRPTAFTDAGRRTTNPGLAYDNTAPPPNSTYADTLTNIDRSPSITYRNWQTTTFNYTTLTLKVNRYSFGHVDDRWGIKYSTNGGNTWQDLDAMSSQNIARATIEINLLPNQDLSQLRIRIDTDKVGKADNGHLYIYDIWTEGNY